MKRLVYILCLCAVCGVACADSITYDTSIVWDEEAFGYAFYFAEVNGGRKHDDSAFHKFLDSLNNNKEQTINNLIKIYQGVFQNASQSELDEFVRTLILTQNKVKGSNLSVPWENTGPIGNSLADLLTSANQTCESARDRDAVMDRMDEADGWGGASSSYEVFIADKNGKTKLISQSDYERGKYKGTLAGIKFSVKYSINRYNKWQMYDKEAISVYMHKFYYSCITTCMTGDSNCGLIEHNFMRQEETEEERKKREKEQKQEEQRTKSIEKQNEREEQEELKQQKQNEKEFQERYKIMLNCKECIFLTNKFFDIL